MDEVSLKKLKVYELKEVCRQLKIRKSGKKGELIDRIREHFSTSFGLSNGAEKRKRNSVQRAPLGCATKHYVDLSNLPNDTDSRSSTGSSYRKRVLSQPPKKKQAVKIKKKSVVPRTKDDLLKTAKYLKIRLLIAKPAAWNAHEKAKEAARRALAKDRAFRADPNESYVIILRAAKMEVCASEDSVDESDTLSEDSEEHQVMWDMYTSGYKVFGIGPVVPVYSLDSAAEANRHVYQLSTALVAFAFPRSKQDIYHRFCRERVVNGLSSVFVHPDAKQKRRSSRKCWQISAIPKNEYEQSYS